MRYVHISSEQKLKPLGQYTTLRRFVKHGIGFHQALHQSVLTLEHDKSTARFWLANQSLAMHLSCLNYGTYDRLPGEIQQQA